MMEAGRELDALVAEKVMGWRADTTGMRGWPNGDFYPGDYYLPLEKIDGCTADSVKTHRWSPSTDIAAAFEVVEKMREKRHGFSLSFTETDKGPDWEAVFIAYPGIPNIEWASIAPLAICLAALRAVGVEV